MDTRETTGGSRPRRATPDPAPAPVPGAPQQAARRLADPVPGSPDDPGALEYASWLQLLRHPGA